MKSTKMDCLEYPEDYEETIANQVNNGCGTSGWKGKLVPDTIYGISIKEPCKIHDYDYYYGDNRDQKNTADIRFYNNLKHTIKHKSKWWNRFLNPLRRVRAWGYFKFLQEFGDDYFFKGDE